ncbi:MAG: SPOR domain-containing protein [Paludibacter sp.]|nr:SPOR domain-containing protein [Paludibacter sp.]MDD4427235.1 SPOR domain-containing protein [Paludibacter sp.]
MKHLLLIILTIFFSANIFSQSVKPDSIRPDTVKNVFREISGKVKPGSGEVIFHQDKRIEKLVTENAAAASVQVVHGYRVQVFSSNVQRTAREEAFNMEQILMEAFPDMKVYVSYSSPFWKVRIGDFHTQPEARSFTEELLRKFPALRKETYTVRDRISVSEK